MTRTGRDPLPIIFVALLIVALLGLSSGYGQDKAPIPLDPTAPKREAPLLEPSDQPLEPELFPTQRLGSPIQQNLTTSSALLMDNLLRAPEASRLFIQASLGVEYSDNFNQENDNPQHGAQTSLSIGSRYQVSGRGAFCLWPTT